jgi:hypothetical protein
VLDAAVARPENQDLANVLAAYTDHGGTELLGYFMSGFSRPPDFDR